jgi:hypothetical protein
VRSLTMVDSSSHARSQSSTSGCRCGRAMRCRGGPRRRGARGRTRCPGGGAGTMLMVIVC